MVMVSHTHKFIFIKTLKTAGTSIEMALQPFCTPPGTPVVEETPTIISEYGIVGQRRWTGERVLDENGVLWNNHMPAKRIRAALGKKTYDSYLKITAVRDPYDKMLSSFHYNRRGMAPLPDDLESHRAAFKDYLIKRGREDRDHKIVFIGNTFQPGFLVKYESMADDLERLGKRLGVSLGAQSLPVTKDTKAGRSGFGIDDYYDDEAREIVRSRVSWLFEHAGYEEKANA